MNSTINTLKLSEAFPYRYIFNPSIIPVEDGRYLLICRMQNNPREGALGLAFLDASFDVKERPQIITDAPSGNSNVMLEDPRIVLLNGEPYVAYVETSPLHLFTTYVVIAKLSGRELMKPLIIPYQRNHDAFVRLRKYDLHISDGHQTTSQNQQPADKNINPKTLPSREWIIEKNWQFFSCNGSAYCVYEANHKHVVFEFDLNNGAVKKEYITYFSSPWKAGNISGGASPILHPDGKLYAFFHSWTADDQKRRTYHMGVYVFENRPPFRIKQISGVPLLSAEDHDRSSPSGHAVIFPGSAFFEPATNEWIIAAGYNDQECVLLRFNHEAIELSLVDAKQVSKWSRQFHIQLTRLKRAINKRISK